MTTNRARDRAEIDLVVAGAGIVGMATALWAAKRGQRVLLCDPAPPGAGASYGNACTLATYGCLPVNSPDILASIPRLLASPESPLSVNYLHALTHPRWLLSFLANCRPARVEAIAATLAAILSHADAGLNPLIEEAGAEDLVVANDALYVWTTRAGFAAAADGNALRHRLGVPAEELGPADVAALEPDLRLPVHRALRFTGARHLRDPQELVRRMQRRFEALGGRVLRHAVTRVRPLADGVEVTTGGETLRAARVAITAGAHATGIAGSGAERLPLDVERGYHLQYPGEAHRLSRPVGWAEAGFYAVPMAQGLRLAGTVEIAGTRRPPNRRRLRYLERKGAEMFGPLKGPAEEWLGFRPSFPDALPVIGPSPRSDRILLAFGHQHLGLTLGGITGRIVADLSEGRAPNLDITGFDAARF
ncbi:NAD(P)/FAD-dependent oxidoreductase [Rhodovulum sp. YNF3179]|uniref:NAD(P)/FAD-dependent oxidoreductase n=1 Tax=Rhodovulum sp. YNF3179 TaxID=3425127 RepID=UPI003D32EFD8